MLNDKKVNLFLDDFFKTIKKIEEKHQMVISIDNIQYLSDTIKAKMVCKQGKPLPYYTKEDFTIGELVRVLHKTINSDEVFSVVKINKVNVKVANERVQLSCPPQWLQKV
jgi:hypothetical protein